MCNVYVSGAEMASFRRLFFDVRCLRGPAVPSLRAAGLDSRPVWVWDIPSSSTRLSAARCDLRRQSMMSEPPLLVSSSEKQVRAGRLEFGAIRTAHANRQSVCSADPALWAVDPHALMKVTCDHDQKSSVLRRWTYAAEPASAVTVACRTPVGKSLMVTTYLKTHRTPPALR